MPDYAASGQNCSIGWLVEGQRPIIHWMDVGASLAGSLPALAYIIVLVVTRAYREFIQRLSLYLAVTSLLVAATWPAWDVASHQLILFQMIARLYAWLAFGLITILVSIYVFAIAIRKVIQNAKHEVLGITIVFVLPLLVCWVPSLPVCEKSSKTIVACVIMIVCVQFIVSDAALFAVLAGLLRRVADKDSFLYQHYKRALRRVLPLFSYVFCLQIPAMLVFAYNIYVVTLDDPASVSLPASGVISLVPCWNFILPLLLICELPRWTAKRVTADENTALRTINVNGALVESTSFSELHSASVGAGYVRVEAD